MEGCLGVSLRFILLDGGERISGKIKIISFVKLSLSEPDYNLTSGCVASERPVTIGII